MIGNNRVITTIDMQQTIGIIRAIVAGLHRRPGFAIAEKMICSDEILRTSYFQEPTFPDKMSAPITSNARTNNAR